MGLHFWSATLQVGTDTVKQQLVELQAASAMPESRQHIPLPAVQGLLGGAPPLPWLRWISQNRVGLKLGVLFKYYSSEVKSSHTNSTRCYLNFTLFILQKLSFL